jgi:hypothetical protein
MIARRDEITYYQSTFYRENYHKVLTGLIVEAIIILVLIVGILYTTIFRASPHFYVTTTSGQILLLPKGT